ncbi:Endoribonuclease YbeY [Candidatus Annandia adelgestsuga]|uniref:Endoribonuclease YbeY n=1 Tax=Candidatus Annandia adelgestsuga TaxID=1302411 RepID=A0A3S5HNY1_9ENTR|nr:rRNA maturation RNase YbeY [Candidatus Annandia adelgestsuga]AZP36358.1 Endoribonuclease YbeY [Candidatus Annandia adelgestsuga]
MKKIICNLKLLCKNKKRILLISKIQYWIISILKYNIFNKEINIIIVDKNEIKKINKIYFKKNKITNIITFDYIKIPNINIITMGEIIICYENIVKESKIYKKKYENHLAHNIIHGILHLIGYNHKSYNDLINMIKLEIIIMKFIGYNNPYFF